MHAAALEKGVGACLGDWCQTGSTLSSRKESVMMAGYARGYSEDSWFGLGPWETCYTASTVRCESLPTSAHCQGATRRHTARVLLTQSESEQSEVRRLLEGSAGDQRQSA